MSKPLMVEIEEILRDELGWDEVQVIIDKISTLLGERVGSVQEKLMEDLHSERQLRYSLEQRIAHLNDLLVRSLEPVDGDSVDA